MGMQSRQMKRSASGGRCTCSSSSSSCAARSERSRRSACRASSLIASTCCSFSSSLLVRSTAVMCGWLRTSLRAQSCECVAALRAGAASPAKDVAGGQQHELGAVRAPQRGRQFVPQLLHVLLARD